MPQKDTLLQPAWPNFWGLHFSWKCSRCACKHRGQGFFSDSSFATDPSYTTTARKRFQNPEHVLISSLEDSSRLGVGQRKLGRKATFETAKTSWKKSVLWKQNKWSCGMDASETETQQQCVAMPSYSGGIACGQTEYGFRTGLTCLVLPKRSPVANQRVADIAQSMSFVPYELHAVCQCILYNF